MLKMRLTWNKCLCDSLFDATPVLVGGQPNSLQSLEKLSQRFLVPQTQIIQRLIKHVFGVIFVYGIVGEVHV